MKDVTQFIFTSEFIIFIDFVQMSFFTTIEVVFCFVTI